MLPSIHLLLVLATVVAADVHVELERRAPPARSPARYQAMAAHLRTKYGAPQYNVSSSSNSRRRKRVTPSSASVALTDLSLDSSYSAKMQIGTPPQTFSVIVDTGSSDLWLAGPDCSSCNMVAFDTAESSSFIDKTSNVKISYGSGQAQGTLAADVVSMGGFTVQQQTLAVVHSLTDGLRVNNVSGLMGLGFESIASTGAAPFWTTLIKAGDWTQPVMSFYLQRWLNKEGATAVEPGGVFTLGGTNTSLYTGAVDFVSLPKGQNGGFWSLPVQTVTLAGQTIDVSTSNNQILGAIDTGTTLIGAPTPFVQEFYSNIAGAQLGTGDWDGFYLYPCATTISLTLNFGGARSWAVSDEDFKLVEIDETGTTCAGALFEINTGGSARGAPDWIVGDTFLKNVYTVFRYDPPAVGFAQLANAGDPTGAAIERGAAPASARVSLAAVTLAVLACVCALAVR